MGKINWDRWERTSDLRWNVGVLEQKFTRTGWPLRRFPSTEWYEHYEEDWRAVPIHTTRSAEDKQ